MSFPQNVLKNRRPKGGDQPIRRKDLEAGTNLYSAARQPEANPALIDGSILVLSIRRAKKRPIYVFRCLAQLL